MGRLSKRTSVYDGNENLCDSNKDLGRESGLLGIFMNWTFVSNVDLGILRVSEWKLFILYIIFAQIFKP